MAIGFDREKLLYAVGILLGVAAVAYFGFQLFDHVSPVTTAALLFAGFLCFLVGGVSSDAEMLDVVAYALAAGCYLVFLAYVLSRFDVGDGGTFLLLAASSGLFIGLGYVAQQGRLAVSRRRATVVVLVVVIASTALVGIDLVGGQPTATTEIEESVEVPEQRERVTVATLIVRNEDVLPHETDAPRLHACVYGPEFRPAPLDYEPTARSALLWGGDARRYDVVIPGRAFYNENGTPRKGFRADDSVPVERRSDCPGSVEEPTVVVADNEPRPPYLGMATADARRGGDPIRTVPGRRPPAATASRAVARGPAR